MPKTCFLKESAGVARIFIIVATILKAPANNKSFVSLICLHISLIHISLIHISLICFKQPPPDRPLKLFNNHFPHRIIIS